MRISSLASAPRTTPSAAGGEFISIRVGLPGRIRRSYERVEASPGKGWRAASTRPARARKSAFNASRSELKGPSFETTVGGEARSSGLSIDGQLYIESGGGQRPFQPLGPFDDGGSGFEGFVEAEFEGFGG